MLAQSITVSSAFQCPDFCKGIKTMWGITYVSPFLFQCPDFCKGIKTPSSTEQFVFQCPDFCKGIKTNTLFEYKVLIVSVPRLL
jgi:hypothetical protein